MEGDEIASTPLRLRQYPGWIKWLCAFVTIATGTFCSIVFKWQNKVEVTPCDKCDRTLFEGALYQTQAMFIGEAFAIIIYWIDGWMSSRSNKAPMFDFTKDVKVYDQPMGHWWFWPICSILDFGATLMIMIALKMTYAATVQMLRNFMVVGAACLQPIMLKKAVKVHEIIGVILITVAMVLTAIPAVLDPDTSLDVTTTQVVIGVLLAVIGTSLQAVQLMLEELFCRRGRSSPLRSVGWEGIGGLFYSFVAWPICEKAGLENVTHSWYASIHSGYITALTLVYLPIALIFNVAGLATTMLGSGLLRSVCFAVRSPLVWIISLIVKWQKYDHWSLASALVFCFGFAVYINLTGFRFGTPTHRWLSMPVHCFHRLTNPDLDEPYDEAEAAARREADLEANQVTSQ